MFLLVLLLFFCFFFNIILLLFWYLNDFGIIFKKTNVYFWGLLFGICFLELRKKGHWEVENDLIVLRKKTTQTTESSMILPVEKH